jgi:hypothetical protein
VTVTRSHLDDGVVADRPPWSRADAWLPGLSHLPISDDPALVGWLIRQFIDDGVAARSHGGHSTAASF